MTENIVIKTLEEPAPSFIKKKHELQGLIKLLEKGSKEAVEMLIATMQDDEADKRLRLSCAEKIINYHVSIQENINNDNMQRQVAQIKLGGGFEKNLKTAETEKPKLPVLDFTTITSA